MPGFFIWWAMSDQLKIQGVVEMSAEGAENALDRVGEKAGQMADRLQREGAKAGSAVDSIGAGADKSAEQFSRAEGRMSASIKRATTNLELLGKTASQKLEFQIGQKGLDASKFEPMLAKLRELESANTRVGVSAAQTAAAMRSVPAQFTDIVVSLQSGQQPMTVLLQQGGQLKDMFGGVGNAAKALGGYVASLVTPFTVAAAAIGGIGYAAYAGSTEMDEFKKNLILTGNISGITADKFNAMAQSMANIGGITRGAAAEALTAMAASGNIGAESIERLTRSALQFEKAGGPAVADTVKQFEALGKEPVKASVELSEKTHYLTLAVYEQIKSLEEQGKASEAAALAQKTWADAIDQRTPQMVQNLGYIESAWKGIKEAAAGAWDSAKSLGREETDLEKRVALLRKIGQANLDIESGSINSNRLKQQKEQWAQELKALVDSNNAKEAEAKKHAAEEAKNKAQIDAAVKYDKLIDDQASKAVKQRKEMQLLDADRAAGLVSEEKYQQAKAAIAKKYEEKGSSRPKVDKAALEAQREAERQQERLNGLLEVGSGVSKTYTADVALLGKALAGGKITTEQYSASASKLWLTQTEAGKAFKASSEAAKDAANAMTAWRSEHESQLAAIAEETSAVGQSAESRKIAIAGLQVEADAKKRIASLNDKLSADARKSAENEINAERDKQKAYVETALRKQQAVEGAYQLEQENRRFAADSILDEKQRAQVILDIDAETWRQRIELAEVGSEERRRLEGAFAQWYSNQLSKPAIESMRKALEAIDSTFHDSFTRMLENGKADWDAFGKALATSFKTAVADEIYKLTIKPIVVSVVSSFAGGAAQAAGSVSGQSGSGIGGVVQGVQAAYGAYNSGISNAANAFATSGVGQYMGLSTAGQAMGPPTAAGAMGYTSSGATMTSSGSSAVASAGWVAAIIAAIYTGLEWSKRGWFNDNSMPGLDREFREVFRRGAGKYDRLFGHNRFTNTDGAGIVGTFDLSGFSGDRYQDYSRKGGTFRSDMRWTDRLKMDSGMDKALDSMMLQAVADTQKIARTLNVEAVKAAEGFTHAFTLQLSENGDYSKAGEKVAAEIEKVQGELAKKLLPNLDELTNFGETSAQAFARLGAEVAVTDTILQMFGKDAAAAFGGVGIASIAARENLIDLAGGLEELGAKAQFFYTNFYSQSEQLQLAGKQAQSMLASGFSELGLSVPASRQAYRDLVESQDLSAESGRRLFNSLLDLADEFDASTKATEALSEMQKQAGINTAGLAVQQLEAINKSKVAQGSIFDTFASDAQKLEAAQKIVSDTFASIGKAVPDSAGAFLALAQSIDPATEAGQGMIAALAKAKDAFAYVRNAADSAAIAAAQSAAEAAIKSFEAAKAALDGKSSGLTDAMQSLVDRFGNLSPVARTVADDLAATRQQLEGLSSGLSDLFNAAQMTDLQRLGKTVGQRDQIRSAVEQLNSDIFEAALKGMSRQDQIGQLKKAEADLWAGMGTAADKGQQASKIRDVLLRRLGLESDDAKDSAGKVAELANQARKDQIDTLKAQIDGMQRMRDLAGQIADFTANLSIGDLSPLSYADQLSAAQAQFEQTLGKAKGGDQQAQGQLTNNAKTYLDEARSYFASSTDYAAIYEKVTGSLKSVASPAESALTAAQSQLDTLSKLPDVMAAMVDTSKDDVAALQAVQAALRSGDDYLTKSIDAQTVALQQQIDALTTIASNQDAQIKQAGAAYQQMTDELKAVKAQLAAIEANGALAGAA